MENSEYFRKRENVEVFCLNALDRGAFLIKVESRNKARYLHGVVSFLPNGQLKVELRIPGEPGTSEKESDVGGSRILRIPLTIMAEK